jgi:E3 ubiquitin-protein ligase NEDD4
VAHEARCWSCTNFTCRNNDITDALELTFSTEDERFGETVSIPLKEGGEDIEVTNENKKEYVE